MGGAGSLPWPEPLGQVAALRPRSQGTRSQCSVFLNYFFCVVLLGVTSTLPFAAERLSEILRPLAAYSVRRGNLSWLVSVRGPRRVPVGEWHAGGSFGRQPPRRFCLRSLHRPRTWHSSYQARAFTFALRMYEPGHHQPAAVARRL